MQSLQCYTFIGNGKSSDLLDISNSNLLLTPPRPAIASPTEQIPLEYEEETNNIQFCRKKYFRLRSSVRKYVE